MEIQVNDLVEVQYHEHLLVGQVYKIHHGLDQFDVMIPEIGIKRFPANCITRIIAREEEIQDQEAPQQADASGDNGGDLTSLLRDYSDGRTGINDITGIYELPGSDGPAFKPDSGSDSSSLGGAE